MAEMTDMFVVMSGDAPKAVADTLEAAQAHAVAMETQYRQDAELRWDEYQPEYQPGVWRLMSRTGGRGRFGWSCYAVHTVPRITA